MDVAELRAVYTATSADFDRVTDHVQRRLKETQAVASGLGGASQAIANEAKKIEQTLTSRAPVKFLGIDVAGEKQAAAEVVNTVKATTTQTSRAIAAAERENIRNFEARIRIIDAGERAAVKAREDAIKATEAANLHSFTQRIKQIDNQQQVEVKAAKATASAVVQSFQGTAKFDSASFWARQGVAATNAAKVTETETKRAAQATASAWSDATKIEEGLHARRAVAATKATSTVVRDAKTGAVLTQAELAKIIGSGSKAVENEAKKVGQATGGVLSNLTKLFLQNNFLFRQLGQRVAGDAGFAAVGVGKLALNFGQLTAASSGAAAGVEGAATSAVSALGAFGPLGIAVAVVAAAFIAIEVAATAAAAGLFFVAKSVSDTEEHFADLNRQTGLSTDNLQVLDIVSRQSGTTLDRLNNSVGQLQRKLIDASEGGTSRLSVGLKKLGIDAEDPNKALNQLIDLLDKLPAGTVRTGAAMQIFGRGGRDVAGVIGEIADQVGSADGALDRLKKQLRDAGVHINSDGVETAANFHKQLVLLEAQFESVKRVIGEEALPTVLRIATRFSDWVGRNRVEVEEWAKHIEHAAEALVRVGIALANLAKFSTGIFIPIIPISRAVAPEAVEIAQGVGAAVSGQPTLPGARFSPVTRGRAPAPQTPQTGPTPETQLARGSLSADAAAQKAAADSAERIRQAFAKTGGGGKGEDPAQIARRLAEIALQETIKGLEAEHEALQRSLDLNLISRDKYTQDAINLELKRRQVTIEGLKKELDEAEKIRKPGQRAIRVAEINARIRDEERRSATEVQKITDESAAEQLRIDQQLADSQVRIVEIQSQQIIARIREFADAREITERQAADFEEQQILRVFNARRRKLEQDERNAINNPEKIAAARNALDELDAEQGAALEAFVRQAQERQRQAALEVIRFAAQVRDAFAQAADVRLQAGEANLEPLRNSILTRHQLWDAEFKFEIERERQRHEAIKATLKDEEANDRITILNKERLAQALSGIRAREAAEEELHQARLRQLEIQRTEQRRQELLRIADDLSDIASQIFDAIGKSSTEFWAALRNTASNFAKQIRDELFKGLLEKAITGQAQGAEGLIGAIINPLLGAKGPNAAVSDNTKATRDNTAAVNALTQTMGGTPPISTAGGLSGVLQFIPGLLGGSRASGGPVEAGRVYRVHENEVFFRPNLNGQIVNLDKAGGLLGSQRDEVRLNVAVGQDAVDDLVESHMLTPKGRRAALVRAKYNRKVGKLLFA